MDPLSLTASAFAVFGAADILVKRGNELFTLISSARHAHAETDCLRTEMSNLTSICTGIRSAWTLQHASTSTVGPVNVPLLLKSVEDVRDELLKHATAALNGGGYHHKWLWRVKWAAGKQKLRESLVDLERQKTSLLLHLAGVSGQGRDNLVNEMENVRFAIEHQQSLLKTDHAEWQIQLRQGLDSIRSDTASVINAHRQTLQCVEAAITAGQASLELVLAGLLRRTNEDAQVRSDKQLAAIGGLSERVQDIQTSFAQLHVVQRASSSQIQFHGPSKEAIMGSLFLIKPKLPAVLSTLLNEQQHEISANQIEWLMSEFNSLLKYACQETAAELASQEPPAPELYVMDENGSGSIERQSSSIGSAQQTRSCSITTEKRKIASTYEGRKKRRQILYSKTWVLNLPIGKVRVRIRTTTSHESRLSNVERHTEIHFSYVPRLKSDLEMSALTALFQRSEMGDKYTRISPLVQCFEVQQYKREIGCCFRDASILEIDEKFRTGRISPYAVYESYYPPMMTAYTIAVEEKRTDLLQYLFDQGLGPKTDWEQEVALSSIWHSVLTGATATTRDDIRRTFNYAVRHGCDIHLVSSLLHSEIWGVEPVNADGVRWWINMIKNEQYDMKSKDANGDNAIMSWCRKASLLGYHVIRLLLETKADICGASFDGRQELRAVSGSEVPWEFGRLPQELYYQILIESGCDINKCDSRGRTPSDDAFQFGRWNEWCSALRAAGYDIRAVLRVDAQRKREFMNRFRNCERRADPIAGISDTTDEEKPLHDLTEILNYDCPHCSKRCADRSINPCHWHATQKFFQRRQSALISYLRFREHVFKLQIDRSSPIWKFRAFLETPPSEQSPLGRYPRFRTIISELVKVDHNILSSLQSLRFLEWNKSFRRGQRLGDYTMEYGLSMKWYFDDLANQAVENSLLDDATKALAGESGLYTRTDITAERIQDSTSEPASNTDPAGCSHFGVNERSYMLVSRRQSSRSDTDEDTIDYSHPENLDLFEDRLCELLSSPD